jgi:hypothetical protein
MRRLTSLVLVLSLAACGGSARNTPTPVSHAAGPGSHAFPGYGDIAGGDQSVSVKAGSQTVVIAIVHAKATHEAKLVWVDASGHWNEIMTLPETFVSNDGDGAETNTLQSSSVSVMGGTDVVSLYGFASGAQSDHSITWFLHWDASRNTFVADAPEVKLRQKPMPMPAVPTQPSVTVTWKAATDPDDRGTYVTSGFPAISADGAAVLLAVQGADDAHGTPHLELLATDLHDVVLEKFAMPKLRPDAGAAPTAAALRSATDFLAASTAKYGWRPLAWHDVSLRDNGGGNGNHASIDGFELSLGSTETVLRISRNGTVLLDKIDLDADVARAHSSAKAKTRTPTCPAAPHVSGIALDEAHSLAVIASTLVTRDGCFLDPVFAVHSWAKHR